MGSKGTYVNKKNYHLIADKFAEMAIYNMDEEERFALLHELFLANLKKTNNPTLLEGWIIEGFGEKFFQDPKVAHILKCFPPNPPKE